MMIECKNESKNQHLHLELTMIGIEPMNVEIHFGSFQWLQVSRSKRLKEIPSMTDHWRETLSFDDHPTGKCLRLCMLRLIKSKSTEVLICFSLFLSLIRHNTIRKEKRLAYLSRGCRSRTARFCRLSSCQVLRYPRDISSDWRRFLRLTTATSTIRISEP